MPEATDKKKSDRQRRVEEKDKDRSDSSSGTAKAEEAASRIVEDITDVLSTPLGETHDSARAVFLACICIAVGSAREILGLSRRNVHNIYNQHTRHKDVLLQYCFNPDILNAINMPCVARGILYSIGYKEVCNMC